MSSTVIIGSIVFVVLGGIVISMIRQKKSGKSSCGCACSGCAAAGSCCPSEKTTGSAKTADKQV